MAPLRVWRLSGAIALLTRPAIFASASSVPDNPGEPCDYTHEGETLSGETVCSYGCFDDEDEACHVGLTQNGCAEIYGHVRWTDRCDCFCRAQICTNGCSQPDGTCEEVTEAECSASGTGTWTDCACEWLDGGRTVVGADEKAGTTNLYFSIPAFVVLFRESLEVVIVLVIIVAFLRKSKEAGTITEDLFFRFRREVYVGAALGFSVCLVMGVGFLVLASLVYKLFSGDSELIFEACMMILTSAVLSFLALNFYKMIHTQEGHTRKMKKQIEEAVLESVRAAEEGTVDWQKKHTFFVLAFTTGLREGLESIVFLVGVVSDVKDLSSLPLPIISALILSRVVGYCFFEGTKKMRVDRFMRFSSILLLFIAAGFFTSSMHNLQELDLFGTWSPKADRPWQNQKVWDATECCNDKTNRFFVLMRALLGWQDQITPVEIFAYFVYWIAATTIGYFFVRKAMRDMEAKFGKPKPSDENKELKTEESENSSGTAIEDESKQAAAKEAALAEEPTAV